MQTPESRRVESGRATIYYEAHGPVDAPAILWVPGGNETHVQYYQNVPHFLRAGYRCILMNLRGHFLSECGDGHCHYRHYADDFIAILDDLDIEKAVLKACSLGGFGGPRMGLRYPDRIAGLILTGSTAGVWSEENFANNERAVAMVMERVGAGALPAVDLNAPDKSFLDRYLCLLGSRDGVRSTPLTAIIAMSHRDSWLTPEQMEGYSTPTTFIGGDTDTFLPAGFQRHTATLIPGATLNKFQNSGHRPFWQDPEEFNDAMSEWLVDIGWVPG